MSQAGKKARFHAITACVLFSHDVPQKCQGLCRGSLQVDSKAYKSTNTLISTDQPHNCNIDEAPQNSSSQNLIRKVKDWRDWTYTDGSLQKNEVGQDTGSGVYHPHLNVSHYVNPKGMGIINTIYVQS